MIAKFTRGTDHRLGIRFEPETFEEQLLLEIFARNAKDYPFKFSSWEHNHPGRAMREGLTSVWGEIVDTKSTPAVADPNPDENYQKAGYQQARRSWLTGIAEDLHQRGVGETDILMHLRLANQQRHPPETEGEVQDIVRKVVAVKHEG
jgi:hypothetical protein